MTDLRALLGPLVIWGHLANLPAAELRPAVARASEHGYGTLWVGEGAGRDRMQPKGRDANYQRSLAAQAFWPANWEPPAR